MSFDLPHTFYQSVKSVSFLGAATKKVVQELQYDWRCNLLLVYYVCVFVFVHLLYTSIIQGVLVFVHLFLQILAWKLEVWVEDQVGDEAVDHRRR